MLRFPLRFLGFLLMAAGFVLVVIDGTRSIAGQRLIVTSLSEVWRSMHAESLARVETVLRAQGPDWLWDPAALTVIAWPAAAAGLILGALLMWVGRSRRPQIGVVGRR